MILLRELWQGHSRNGDGARKWVGADRNAGRRPKCPCNLDHVMIRKKSVSHAIGDRQILQHPLISSPIRRRLLLSLTSNIAMRLQRELWQGHSRKGDWARKWVGADRNAGARAEMPLLSG
ncbi:hypothetical protein CDAR_540601 [Caerostris darwini]|uniref:Uncharacterized protein n=1 Tax=Caerostris darwini TaxID=1538125 RepID=A0AAV4VLL1_9ARAC|nr:hypothetical protein CDAR_540601 [Caerostris darwini]